MNRSDHGDVDETNLEGLFDFTVYHLRDGLLRDVPSVQAD